MRSSIFIYLLVFCPIVCLAQKGPVFTSGNTIDYGLISYGTEKSTRSIEFKNTGNEPLLITDVKSSCGCLVPVYFPKTPVGANKTDSIVVKYDTKRRGIFMKTITVITNEIHSKDMNGNNLYKTHVIKVIGEVSESGDTHEKETTPENEGSDPKN